MADIDIQEKKGSPWPWIIGLLALVLVVWVGYEMLADDDQEFAVTTPAQEEPAGTFDPAAPAATAGAPAEVQRFEEECVQGQAGQQMSQEHEYAQTCVRHMTAALDAVVQREQVNDQQLSQQLEQFRSRAAELTTDPASQEHSVQLDAIFDDAAGLISSIEESRTGAGQTAGAADRVQEAADAFSADGTVLDQQAEVTAFFREAAAAMRQLADGRQMQP